MLSFGAPLWLAGLALVLLIRWLHRGGPHRRRVAVSHLGLWSGAAAPAPAAGERRPPDPAWRRRALLAGLLALALADPTWPEASRRLTLWVDDSLSMLTREADGRTRLQIGLDRVREALAREPADEVEVRALGNPWRALGPPDEAAWAMLRDGAGHLGPTTVAADPPAPPAALLQEDRGHWLLTDGADDSVLQWPDGRMPQRLLRVGDVARNVGLRRASARRGDAKGSDHMLRVEVVNGGDTAESRELIVAPVAGATQRRQLALPARSTVAVRLSIGGVGRVKLRLEPADALSEDDVLDLVIAPLHGRSVAVDRGCGASVAAAIDAHPGLSRREPGDGLIQAQILCGDAQGAAEVPTLIVRHDGPAALVSGAWRWRASSAPEPAWTPELRAVRVAGHLQASAGDQVLLGAGDEPLVVRRPGAPVRIETVIDFEALARESGPTDAAVPWLVAHLVDELFGAPMLDPVVAVDRGERAAWVAPSAAPAVDRTAPAQPAPGAPPKRHLAWPLAALAVIVLLWEVAALSRRWRRTG